MLQDLGMTVTDIAYLLGYSEPTQFSYAFRRIAVIKPRGCIVRHTCAEKI
jgi:AraC-like DNA-binding protein